MISYNKLLEFCAFHNVGQRLAWPYSFFVSGAIFLWSSTWLAKLLLRSIEPIGWAPPPRYALRVAGFFLFVMIWGLLGLLSQYILRATTRFLHKNLQRLYARSRHVFLGSDEPTLPE